LDVQKFDILTVYLMYGANVRHLAKFHQNRSNGCGYMSIEQFSPCRPSAILDFGNSNFLTVWALNRPILHNHAKFRAIPCCDIAICVVFQDDDCRHLVFNFHVLSPVGVQSVSPCQISSKSVKRLQRYGDLTVFKMAAVRHLGFWKFKFFNVLGS